MYKLKTICLAVLIAFAGCTDKKTSAGNQSGAAITASVTSAKTILFFGDSLTAGYGLDDVSEAFPGVVQNKIDSAKLPYKVVNAGLSGETSAGGLGRIN